ncbi:MAG: thiamine-phosphate kinase [Candidatus Latescibacteria bacterium]|nr:thiamine-phosphate kinase [Candidatus Latescibacterota bacterium]
MATVHDLGEFRLIDRLSQLVEAAGLEPPAVGGFHLLLGIGDDAAAWHVGAGLLVTTTDTMVEDVHFTQTTTPWLDVGWKVMAANLSDIAAMGALPLCAVVTLGIPGSLPVSAVEALYAGMLEACHRYRFLLVGGDIVSSPRSFVTVALTGLCPKHPLTRASAQPGDAVAVTGPLGGSAGGLQLLLSDTQPPHSEAFHHLVRAHRWPEPRLDEAQRLVQAGIRCAMDVSDGLVTDLAKLCRASGLSARVYAAQVPVDPPLAQLIPTEALQLALNGGEEYELIFTGRPALVRELITAAMPRGAVIGEVTSGPPGKVTVLDHQGRELAVATHGWEHLR